jgi:hypothetical protein
MSNNVHTHGISRQKNTCYRCSFENSHTLNIVPNNEQNNVNNLPKNEANNVSNTVHRHGISKQKNLFIAQEPKP